MELPWSDLGLEAFRVATDETAALFHRGSEPSAAAAPEAPVTIVYGDDTSGGTTIDLRTLARVLLPTLRDHRPATVCAHFSLPCDQPPSPEQLAALFEAFVRELVHLDRDVLGLLCELVDDPLAQLFRRALLHDAPRESARPDAETVVQEPPAAAVSNAPVAPAAPVEEVLGRDGPISRRLSNYEARPGQIEMARGVADVFAGGGARLIEAGPGTGKTFAYLVPTILLLERGSARVVVSTRTKPLQEQLFQKDLPFLVDALGARLKAALLKGRENYLCLRRWRFVVAESAGSLDRDRLRRLAPLVRWIVTTETGDIEENTAFLSQPGARGLWNELCDSASHCTDQYCPHLDECFAIRARRRARAADLLVVNHSLLLGDLATGGLVLGKYSHLIVDEAHALEAAARAAFTETLSKDAVDRLADEIAPTRRRQGWLSRLRDVDPSALRRCTELLGAARADAASLFSAVSSHLPPDRNGAAPAWEHPAPFAALAERLTQVGLAVESLLDGLDDPQLIREGEAHLATAERLVTLTRRLMHPPIENAVHWFERGARSVRLHASPLDIAPLLAERLYPDLDAVVLTSATLSLNGDFSYSVRSLGLKGGFDDVDTQVVPSPFAHDDRMRIYVPRFLPSVTAPTAEYADALAALTASIVRRTHRKALVLCTSYHLLHAIRDRLPDDLPTLAQGVDGPRSRLVDQFRTHDGRMILLGTDSFWEGVDLPGDALELLIVSRLPFPVPSDPIQSALAERLARDGGDPFADLAVPQAILKLRQGIGRLIRTRRDHGIVLIADHRVVSKGYGRRFARSLPVSPRTFGAAEPLIAAVAHWFAEPPSPQSAKSDGD
jgi:ATP-dependent DNA helicase DinG